MQSDNPTCISIVEDKHPDGTGKPARRNLRLEVLGLRLEASDLRKRLKLSEDVASRHAVMLREGDHRIKNSLQLVSSLMRVQARREASVPARDALRSAAARVSSIAGIHDALQSTGGADLVDLGAVLKKMCASLQDMAGDEGHIDVRVEAEAMQISVQLAQAIVLSANELVVNALRHAFPGRETGIIQITLTHTEDRLSLSVADDGVGMSAHDSAGNGYGMTLVNMMIRKIGGELLIGHESGTRFTIHVPLQQVTPTGK